MTWHEIAGLFEKIELRLIQSLKRNLARHKAWEQEEGFNWPAWQAEKLENLERFRQGNKAVMDEYTDRIDLETRRLMEEQFEEGGLQVDEESEDVDVSPPKNAFFGVNEPRLEKLIEDMQQVEQRAESAALRMMDDVYRRAILQAETAMSAGAVTLPQAIDMAVKDFLQQGITCIEYKDGSRRNIADYAQMALRTASTRSYLQGEAARRVEYGIDTVLVSQYGQCSNTCLPWQGRVYIDDVWGNFQGERAGDRGKSRNGNWYPLLSVAVASGLFHPNCRHTLSTWYEGISKMPVPMDGEKIRRDAALEQHQRALEKKIREYKRMAEGLHEQNLVKEYKRKTVDAQKELRAFIAEHNDVLRRDYWREKTYDVPKPKYAAASAINSTGTKVHFDSGADYAITLPEYPEEVTKGLSDASRIVAELGEKDSREHMVLVDLNNGKSVYQEGGSGDSVGGSEFWKFIREHSESHFAFVHNHNDDGFFSETDLTTLTTVESIDAMVATRLDAVKYVALKDKAIPMPSGMWDLEFEEELKELNNLSRSGKISAGERTHRRERIIVENILKRYVRGYSEQDGRHKL